MEHLTRVLLEIAVMDADQLRQILDQYKTSPQLAPFTTAAAPTTTVEAARETIAPGEAAHSV